MIRKAFWQSSYHANVFKSYPKSFLNHSKSFHENRQLKSYTTALSNSSSGQKNDDPSRTLIQKVVHYVEKTTYMEDVRTSQRHVMEIKRQLLAAGEEKRSIMQKLDNIRNDLNHTYKDMKINRAKETYLDLARKEIELCETEKHFSDLYKEIDKKEQLLFTEFSTAINASYEKEKLHTNFIKVISILGTVASSFIALIFSIFMHTYQQRIFLNQRSLDDSVINTVKALENKVSELLVELNQSKNQLPDDNREAKESWGSFIHRYTRWTYSWAIKSS